jgi:hypothetical protein
MAAASDANGTISEGMVPVPTRMQYAASIVGKR